MLCKGEVDVWERWRKNVSQRVLIKRKEKRFALEKSY